MRASDSPEKDAAEVAGHNRASFAHFALENLFDLSPDAIFVTDTQGVIRAANPRAAELFGHTPDELAGQPIEVLVPARFRGRHPSHRENYSAHPRTRQMGAAMNLFGLRKDGTEFPVDIMLKPLETAEGPVVLSFIRDVTDQVMAREALRRADLQLRTLVDSVGDYAIYLLDKDGCVATWNPGAQRIKGYSVEEILGMHFSRFFTQEEVDRGRPAQLLRLARERGRVEEEGWRVRKDGSRFWANVILIAIRDDTGAVTGYAKVTRDFTDRKRAEESVMMQLSGALLASHDFRRLLVAISASLKDAIPHDMASLALYDNETADMAGLFLNSERGELMQDETRVSLDGSISGQVFKTREPMVLTTMPSADLAPETARITARLELNSGCWVPLVHSGVVIGTLGILSRHQAAFEQRDIEILVPIAAQIAMALDNAMAYKRLAELRDQLRQEKQYLQDEINLENRFDDIVGESAGLRQVLKEIETVAPTDATVLIQGETGHGQRAACPRAASAKPTQRADVYQAQLRRHSRRPVGERTVRP